MPSYRRKPATISAIKLSARVTLESMGKAIVGEVGDWFVTDELGKHFIYTDTLFLQIHELVPGPP